MESILIYLLVAVIICGVLIAIIRICPFDEWIKQAATWIIAAIFLIIVLVKVLLPLLHSTNL